MPNITQLVIVKEFRVMGEKVKTSLAGNNNRKQSGSASEDLVTSFSISLLTVYALVLFHSVATPGRPVSRDLSCFESVRPFH